MLLSIIVPVYNVESYINECVESLLNQTYKDMEIILVDDESTDSSGKICDDLAKNNGQVIALHKKNGGPMSAVREGFYNCSGNVVGFVDSDDWVDSDMYEKLVSTMQRDNSDIVSCGLIKGNIYNQSSNYDGCYSTESLYSEAINNGSFMGRGIIPSRVVKIFKRGVLSDALPCCRDDNFFGEDMVMSFAAFLNADRILFIKDYFPYHYRINQHSVTHTFNSNLYDQVILFTDTLQTIAEEKNVYDFHTQILADRLGNLINIIETACFSNIDYSNLYRFVLKVVNDPVIEENSDVIDISGWESRYKLYYKLYSKKNVRGLIAYSKLLCFLRKTKRKMI